MVVDIVVVHDDKLRLQWRLAIVEELIRGRDNLVRTAHIRMGNYRTTRPIVKLYPLEVSYSDDNTSQETPDDNTQCICDSDLPMDDSSTSSSERRKAASKAYRKSQTGQPCYAGPWRT